MPKKKPDNDGKPPHYDNHNGVETIDAIIAMGSGVAIGFCRGNIVKYIMRYSAKGGIRDLRKAQWYMKLLVGLEAFAKDWPDSKLRTARELIEYGERSK